ncbi:MAG: hypothetical protein RL226_64 [Bacteroidota bacterium]|jgi:hypothetical protein
MNQVLLVINCFPVGPPTPSVSFGDFVIAAALLIVFSLILIYLLSNRFKKIEADSVNEEEPAFYASKNIFGLDSNTSDSFSNQLPRPTRFKKIQIVMAIILIILLVFAESSDLLVYDWWNGY